MSHLQRKTAASTALAGAFVLLLAAIPALAESYISPVAIAADEANGRLFVADATGSRVLMLDTQSGAVQQEARLTESPNGLWLSPDSATLCIPAGEAKGLVYLLDVASWNLRGTVTAGHTPQAAMLDGAGSTLYVCNRFNDSVGVYDAASGAALASIPVGREPFAMALSQDGARLFVANHLPAGAADGAYTASFVSVVDTAGRTETCRIELPNGSTALRGICLSPDGKYAYVSHILGRYQLPTTQLERGWMNTNALTVLDVAKAERVNTLLLDSVDLGAANPWAVACTCDGALLCVTHAGTQELSVIDRPALHEKLDKVAAGEAVSEVSQSAEDVPNDLAFLVDLRRRIKLDVNGTRSLAIIGRTAYVGGYFSGNIGVVDLDNERRPLLATLFLGPQPEADSVRWGEQLFNDATLCFQSWQCCASCHPDIRADALNWDLLNDGMGNPKNTKSLLFSHVTPPSMMLAVRATAEDAVRAGIKHIQFAVRPEEEAQAIDEFLKALRPVPSPYLVNRALSESAQRGQVLFEQAGCIQCHNGDYFTDLKQYDVGTGKGREEGKAFDTPTLREVWRTAPYLHDGRAATMVEVLSTANPEDTHGITQSLTETQLQDLAAYVLSL